MPSGTSVAGWPALLFVALVLIVASLLRDQNPKAPGPFLARFSNLWQSYRMARGQFHKEVTGMHKTYGKVVRLGPAYYSLDDPEAAKIIYGHGTQFRKSSWYDIWNAMPEMLPGNIFAQRDIKMHSASRRRYANLYAMSSLVGYEPYVDNCIDILDRRLALGAKDGASMDLGRWFQFYAFDVIGEITFSKRFGFMEAEEDIGNVIQAIGTSLELFSVAGFFQSLTALFHSIAAYSGAGVPAISKLSSERIAEAKQALIHGDDEPDPEERQRAVPDFCAKLLAMTENYEAGKNQGLGADLFVEVACLQNVFAGSDTTSISLNATYFNIITRADVLSRLRAELDEAHASGALGDPPAFAETQRLPYLQAVLREGLRVHPAVGLPLWREVPAPGATLCGTYFPPGTNVGISSWVMHRNTAVWGHDADIYRPERWLESSEARLKEMNAAYMPFGLGSRTCIGKNISLLEISKVIPHLVRKFDATVTGPAAEGKTPDLPARCAWFVKQRDFVVSMRPRVSVMPPVSS